jgi:diacylglycerol kinase family enzyme
MPRPLATSGPGCGGELARRAAEEGADLVMVLGGDGTVNEVLQGVVGTGAALGVLPGGTANCLAMELGLSTRIERAAERLAACEPVPVAVGRLAGPSQAPRYFLLMCGVGLDAAIVYEVSAGLKAAAGKLAYWMAGLAQFRRRVGAVEVRVNGQTYSAGFALASRIRNYGGDLEIASGASLRRADFEVVLFAGSHPLRYAGYMLGVAARRVRKLPGVRSCRATSLEVLSCAPAQVDGEYYGRGPLRIDTVPGALQLLLPPDYR